MSQGQKASETWAWLSDAVAAHPDALGISSSLLTPGDCRTTPLPVPVSSLIKNGVSLRLKDASSSEESMAVASPGDSVPSIARPTTEAPGVMPLSFAYPRLRAYCPREQRAPKGFVPPDLTDMNKSEARLAKNRAAAFLSRHRKREAFTAMAHRVEQLQEENALLRNRLSERTGCPPVVVDIRDVRTNIEQTRRKLYDTEARVAVLREQLGRAARSRLAATARTSACTRTVVHAERALRPPETHWHGRTLSAESVHDLLLLMAVSNVLHNKLASIWTDSVRVCLSSSALRCCGRPQSEIGQATFELNIAPWPIQGRLQVIIRHVSHVPAVQLGPLAPWSGHAHDCPGTTLELPMSLSELGGYGSASTSGAKGTRMHVAMSRSSVPGMWNVDVA